MGYDLNVYYNGEHGTPIPCQCDTCGKEFTTKKKNITKSLQKNRSVIFCGRDCVYAYRHKDCRFNVTCNCCGKEFTKVKCQIVEGGNNYCSNSCNATYINTHKTFGTRRSKLEIWLEDKLTKLYPDLDIHYGRKDAINSELDIYIPSMKLAFELNGIFHYEPIFGKDKLDKIQNNDNRKFQACLEQGIELCIIDTSSQKYVKDSTCQKFLDIIVNILSSVSESN
jgi:hypothetical protein